MYIFSNVVIPIVMFLHPFCRIFLHHFLFVLFSIGIDGQEGMKPIFGTIAAEGKVRLAKVDKVKHLNKLLRSIICPYCFIKVLIFLS